MISFGNNFIDPYLHALVALMPNASVTTLVIVSALLPGLLVGVIWYWTIPARVSRRAADRAWARFMGIAVYREDPAALLRAARRLLTASLWQLCLLLPPILAAVAVLALSYPSLNHWFGVRPFYPGEQTNLSLKFKKGQWGTPSLKTGPEVTIGLAPLHNPLENEIEWRLTCVSPGITEIVILYSGATVKTALQISLVQGLLAVPVIAMPPDSPFESVTIHYPARPGIVLGSTEIPWWALSLGVMLGIAQLTRYLIFAPCRLARQERTIG